jgi:hypothetical protein
MATRHQSGSWLMRCAKCAILPPNANEQPYLFRAGDLRMSASGMLTMIGKEVPDFRPGQQLRPLTFV